jgi:hypothetical protein
LALIVMNTHAPMRRPDPVQKLTLGIGVIDWQRVALLPIGTRGGDEKGRGDILLSCGWVARVATGVATAPGYLVLSEVWYPGRQATVNGEPVRVIPANGASTGELWFGPRAWTWGLFLAGVGLVVAVGLLWLGWRR